MKRFKRLFTDTKTFRGDMVHFAIISVILAVTIPWLIRGVSEVLPYVVDYYGWVRNLGR